METNYYVCCDALGEPLRSEACPSYEFAKRCLVLVRDTWNKLGIDLDFWIMECKEVDGEATSVKIHSDIPRLN